MKKEHSVFITLTADEAGQLLHPVFKRLGWLKDIPKEVELIPFDDSTEISFEYHWEENDR